MRKFLKKIAPKLPVGHLTDEEIEIVFDVALDVTKFGDDTSIMNMTFCLEGCGFSSHEARKYAHGIKCDPDQAYRIENHLNKKAA